MDGTSPASVLVREAGGVVQFDGAEGGRPVGFGDLGACPRIPVGCVAGAGGAGARRGGEGDADDGSVGDVAASS